MAKKILTDLDHQRAKADLDRLETAYWPKRQRLRELLGSGHGHYHTALNTMKQEISQLRARIQDYEQGR